MNKHSNAIQRKHAVGSARGWETHVEPAGAEHGAAVLSDQEVQMPRIEAREFRIPGRYDVVPKRAQSPGCHLIITLRTAVALKPEEVANVYEEDSVVLRALSLHAVRQARRGAHEAMQVVGM